TLLSELGILYFLSKSTDKSLIIPTFAFFELLEVIVLLELLAPLEELVLFEESLQPVIVTQVIINTRNNKNAFFIIKFLLYSPLFH
ncbi:MAG: hypothetical protein SO047_03440, partial [Ruminococcus bovis]